VFKRVRPRYHPILPTFRRCRTFLSSSFYLTYQCVIVSTASYLLFGRFVRPALFEISLLLSLSRILSLVLDEDIPSSPSSDPMFSSPSFWNLFFCLFLPSTWLRMLLRMGGLNTLSGCPNMLPPHIWHRPTNRAPSCVLFTFFRWDTLAHEAFLLLRARQGWARALSFPSRRA